MGNLLLEQPEYQITETRLGVWRRYVYSTGGVFEEFRSHGTFAGLPWIHFTRGRSPETGRRVVAKGVVAVGRIAAGVLAVGQASVGVLAVGQLGLGLLFGLGQATCGWMAVGQVALGLEYGLGQLATGATVIAQAGYGEHVLAQVGWGEHVWSTERHDPAAREHFRALWQGIQQALGRWF